MLRTTCLFSTYRYTCWATGLLLACIFLPGCRQANTPLPTKDWPAYGGNKAGNRYSALEQVTVKNVQDLQLAGTYNTALTGNGEIQCQPIVVNGVFYGTTPGLALFALDAGTGKEIWKFVPPAVDRPQHSRGVMYWENGADKRILYTVGAGLYAVNALTGKLVTSFGTHGRADLHAGLQTGFGVDVSTLSVTATSPGVIYKNILIMGSTVSEGGDAAPGHIRAFDVVSGRLLWVFHTIPQPGEPGYETWPPDAYKKIGGANCWSGLVLDEKRGVVYFGTGSPASDFYGGDRMGANLYANCIMALDAGTGRIKWHYQTIHHDLWDRDQPCQPNLATVMHRGKKTDVVVQATKDGLVYVLDRGNGTSLFPVEERAVPTAGLPGEQPYATQPFPLKPAPFARQEFTEADLTNLSPAAHAYTKEHFRNKKTNKFSPPDTTGTLLMGYSGGAEWGGNAVSPDGILYQNANEEPWVLTMKKQGAQAQAGTAAHATSGQALYIANCAPCHGQDRKGNGPELPALVGIENKRTPADIRNLLVTGSGRMPSFRRLEESERDMIIRYITHAENQPATNQPATNRVAPGVQKKKRDKTDTGQPYLPAYVIAQWSRFTDQEGYPGIKPPWGTLNAIDLNTGAYVWRIPLGEYPALAKKGIPATGTNSYGGPLVTAGGLVFIAGTKDEKLRAYDKNTGRMVWQYQLPAGGFATPITYEAGGKQYIAIAAGGGRDQKPGGNYMAFALQQR